MVIRLALIVLLATPMVLHGQIAGNDDRAAVIRAVQGYRDAWLANDRRRVMATLAADATIYPSGLPPIAGGEAIARFWFPATGPATRVTAIEVSVDDLHVDGDVAIAAGHGSLTFVVATGGLDGSPRTQRHWHVNVLRRQPDGRWLIWKRMWGDQR